MRNAAEEGSCFHQRRWVQCSLGPCRRRLAFCSSRQRRRASSMVSPRWRLSHSLKSSGKALPLASLQRVFIMSCKHIKHLQIYKEVVALVLINHVCLGFIFTFSNQLIEYALECLYPCYDLNTENSGLVSLLLSDFSGSMRFDMAYSMSIEQRFTGGFGNSFIQNCILLGYQRNFRKLPQVFQYWHNISLCRRVWHLRGGV